LPLFRAIDADAIFDIFFPLILILIAITPPCRFSLPLSIFGFAISFQHISLIFELALADRVLRHAASMIFMTAAPLRRHTAR
jgi:hypothetical protein